VNTTRIVPLLQYLTAEGFLVIAAVPRKTEWLVLYVHDRKCNTPSCAHVKRFPDDDWQIIRTFFFTKWRDPSSDCLPQN